MRSSCIGFALVFAIACGDQGSTEDGTSGAAPAGPPPSANGGPERQGDIEIAKDLTGVWSIAGKDARGAYHGQAEVRSDGAFVRAIAYDGLTVEDGRTLHWAFLGTAKGDVAKEMTIAVTLDNRDFIRARGKVTRTLADAPVSVSGKIAFDAKTGHATATYSVGGDETWNEKKPSGASPIVVVDRKILPAHDPPSATEKQTYFQAYASYQALPAVIPYTSRPDFQAAVAGHVVDTTDFEFYRANPNALRVIGKTIDDISLGEALSRANAYRKTLAEKAAGFDDEIEKEFISPDTGMLLDGPNGGVHMSAALWTGIYAASQVLRWEITGDATAKANVEKTLDGILKLQEVTGNWKEFARAIRPATGDTTGGWHTGAGALANLEWLEGGNNDMMKGLYISYVLANRALCKGPGFESLCSRIRTNSKHLSDDVNVDRGSDELDSAWLTAVVSTDVVTKTQYQGKTVAAWEIYRTPIAANTQLYTPSTGADWSGLNLGFVGDLFKMVLADAYDVDGNGKSTYAKLIKDSWGSLKRQRLPLWNLLQAIGSGTPDAAAIEDAKWRLREMPFPKPLHDVDHRVSPEYSMSPYPALPWKNDWTTTDRTQSLRSYPLFENAMDLYTFRAGMNYAGNVTTRPPAPEYLIAYWFGRKYGLISATE